MKIRNVLLLLMMSSLIFVSCHTDPYILGQVTDSNGLIEALKDSSQKEIMLKAGTYSFSDDLVVDRDVHLYTNEGIATISFPKGKGILVSEKLGNGDFAISNFKVNGVFTVKGGGSNSITLTNTEIGELILDKDSSAQSSEILRVVFKGNTSIEKMVVNKDAVLELTDSDHKTPVLDSTIKDNASVIVVGDTSNKIEESLDEASKDNIKPGVARIRNEYFYDVLDAFVALDSGETLQMLEDVTISAPELNLLEPITVEAGQDWTIDFNGHTLTYIGYDSEDSAHCVRPFIINGKLTVKNPSSEPGKGGIEVPTWQTYGIFDVKEGGSLVVDGGYYHTNGGNDGALIRGRIGSEIIVNDGQFIVDKNGENSGFDAAFNSEGKSVINNGVFKSTSSNIGKHSYTLRSSGDIVINYAEVEGIQGGVGIVGGKGVINNVKSIIKESPDGEDRSHYALYIAGGKSKVVCEVNGGYYEAPTKYALYCGNSIPGDGGLALDARVCVNGGTFVAKKSNPIHVDGKVGTAILKGGCYSSSIDEKYIADGYSIKNDNDVYNIYSNDAIPSGVLISGVSGYEKKVFNSPSEAYDEISSFLSKNGGVGQGGLTSEEFIKVFPDNGKVIWNIYGAQEIPNNDEHPYFLSFGRTSMHYSSTNHLDSISIIGRNAEAKLKYNKLGFPYEWWNEDHIFTLSFENLALENYDSTGSIMAGQAYTDGVNATYKNCSIKGKMYCYINRKYSLTVEDCVFTPIDGGYAIHVQGHESEPATINIVNSKFYNSRGVNIDQATCTANIQNCTFDNCGNLSGKIENNYYGALQITQGSSVSVENNRFSNCKGNAIWMWSNKDGGAFGGNLVVKNNTIKDCTYAFASYNNQKDYTLHSSGNVMTNTDPINCYARLYDEAGSAIYKVIESEKHL